MNVHFILFLDLLLQINSKVNIGANNAQSQNKESTINPKIHISFKNLYLFRTPLVENDIRVSVQCFSDSRECIDSTLAG